MFPPVSKIKQMRLTLDMTQAELASRSGVSQSTVTKIERGTIHGSYEAVANIFRVLQEGLDKRRAGREVKEVATREVIGVQEKESLRRASELMRENGFSQLPVFNGKVHVGSVSERGILLLLREGISMAELGERSVESSMEEPFPIVGESTFLEAITPLISHSGAVLMANRGEITGIVTSSDVLMLM